MNALLSRETGKFPISIATSLAIESALGVHDDSPPNIIPIKKYDELWINVKTLYRNLLGAVPTADRDSINVNDAATEIINEINTITTLISEVNFGKIKTVFYISDYDAGSKYKDAVLRMDNTPKQILYTKCMKAVLGTVLQAFNNPNSMSPNPIMLFRLKLEPKIACKALIVTHHAFDLISEKRFRELDLLESHTGKIKSKYEWYTKYVDGRSIPMIPFNEAFLQIFGDSEMFRPASIKLKRDIIELATEYKWNQSTTRDKILYCVKTLKNFVERDIILKLVS